MLALSVCASSCPVLFLSGVIRSHICYRYIQRTIISTATKHTVHVMRYSVVSNYGQTPRKYKYPTSASPSYPNGIPMVQPTNHPTQQLRVTPSAPQSFLVSCLVSASAAARSTSVRGQKWLRSPTGRLSGRRISAAMMMNVMYHPSIATTKMSAPPAWFIISLPRYVRGY